MLLKPGSPNRQFDSGFCVNCDGHQVESQKGAEDEIVGSEDTGGLVAGELFDVQADEADQQGEED